MRRGSPSPGLGTLPRVDPLLPTVTHARLRARQGDARAARRILHAILAGDPGNGAARALLEEIGGRPDAPASDPVEAAAEPPRAARASELRERFQAALSDPRSSRRRSIERLEALLRKVEAARK